jgi:hypothetical protein
MNSLKDVYQSLVEHEKTAAQAQPASPQLDNEQTKLAMQQALDYDHVGRELARHVFRDMVKEAAEHMPMGHGPGHKHEDGMPCRADCEHHGKGAAHAEKQASLEQVILDRMQSDPAYFAELVAKHRGG